MKKLKLFLLTCFPVLMGTVNVFADKTVYVDPIGANAWTADNAKISLYVFGDGDGWASADSLSDGVIKFTFDDRFTSMIIVRGQNKDTWDGKWNQTDDITNIQLNKLYKANGYDNGIKLAYTVEEYIIGQSLIANGTYFIKNVGTQKYLAAGDSWGAHAVVNETGLDFIITLTGGKYTLDSQVSNGGDSHFLNGEWTDSNYFGWTIDEVSEGVFTISDGTQYLTAGENGVVTLGSDATIEAAKWTLETQADRVAEMATATTVTPVNATFLIRDADFGRNDLRRSAWTMEASNQNLSGGNNMNNCAESYHSTFTLSQTIENVPNGNYELTAQGFYRQDGGDDINLPYFYINNEIQTFPVKTGSENSMSDASVSFTAGQYTISPIRVTVTDGTITLGAKLENNTQLWCIWDNFQLTYYGNGDAGIEEYENALEIAIAKVTVLEGTIPTSVYNNAYAVVAANTGDNKPTTISEYEAAIEAIVAAAETAKAYVAPYAEFNVMKTKAETLKAVPNDNETANNNLGTAINMQSAAAEAATTIAAIDSATTELKTAMTTYVNVARPVGDGAQFDITFTLNNPDFGTNDWTGWTRDAETGGNVVVSRSCAEAWNNGSFDIYQVVEGAPQGVYEIEVQGFYRYLRDDNAWNAWKNKTTPYVESGGAPVYVYMNNNKTPFANIFDEPVDVGTLYTTDGAYMYPAVMMPLEDGEGHWYPNEMYNSSLAFSAGMYKQSAFGLVAQKGDLLKLGVMGATNQGDDSWVIWDNFKLLYLGFKADVIKPVLEQAIADMNVYVGMPMGKTEYATMTAALNAAAEAIENNDGTAMFQTLNALYDVKSSVQASRDLFASNNVAESISLLENTISDLSEAKLSQATLAQANALLEGLKSNSIYENSSADQIATDVNAQMNALNNSVAGYGTLKTAIDNLGTVMELEAFQEVLDEAAELLSNTTTAYNVGTITDADVANKITELESMIQRIRSSAEEYEVYKMRQNSIVSNEEWLLLKQANEILQCWIFDNEERITADLDGVTAANGHVVSIDLSRKNIYSIFPYSLLSLPALESLNLSGNGLMGTIDESAQATGILSSSLKYLDISSNMLMGNIGILAQCCPNLTSLKASGNFFDDVYPMISPNVTELDISNQIISEVVDMHLRNLSDGNFIASIPRILLYDHENQTYTQNIDMLCITSDNSWAMMMAYRDGEMVLPYGSGQNAYHGASGDTLNVIVMNNGGLTVGGTFQIAMSFDEGDANFDGMVDVLDVQADINFIFESYLEQAFNFTAANLWNDDIINVQDVVRLVDLLMEQDVDTPEPNMAKKAKNEDVEVEAWLSCENGQLIANTSRPIAAFDITLKGCSTFSMDEALKRCGMTCRVKQMPDGIRIIGYSLTGASLDEGEQLIGTVGNTNATITRAVLSGIDASRIKSKTTGVTTNIQKTDIQKAKERCRLSIGAGRSIIIDDKGTKTIQKNLTK